MFKSNINSIFFTCCGFGRDEIHRSPQVEVKARAKRNGQSGDKMILLIRFMQIYGRAFFMDALTGKVE